MSDLSKTWTARYLPEVAAATTLVALVPIAVVWWLRAAGVISSIWVCVLVATALSLGASSVGSAYWKRRRGPTDLLFSELLLWGWLRRLRAERQLANAVELLGLARVDGRLPEIEGSPTRKSQLLNQLAVALEAQDPYVDGHSRRVAREAMMVARRMGLSTEAVAKIGAAAAVHDIGKLRVPAEVLNKPDTLTWDEFEIVKRHADEGADIVACLGDRELSAMVRHHHEHFDGTGYPAGLLGNRVPLGARIIAVADTFDAMTSPRPYRRALPHKQAIDALLNASGTQLDPVAVRAFLRCYSGNRAMVFWAFLAVSPQRAFAWMHGTPSASSSVPLGATVSSVAATTAIGAIAIGSSLGVAPARYALSGSLQPPYRHVAGAPILPKPAKRASRPTQTVVTPLPPATPAVRHVSLVARPRRAARRTGPAATGAAPGYVSSQTPSGGSGANHRGGSVVAPGTGSHTPPSGGPGGPPPGGGPGGPPPSGGPGGPPPGGGPGGPPPGGGAGGPPPGGGPVTPTSKDQCKDGGYAKYGFPNQGQCVAYVEHQSH